MANVLKTVIKQYQDSGLLIRGNDGQTPATVQDVNTAISNLVIDKSKITPTNGLTSDLLGFLQNEAPTYSASLLSGKNAPLLWYNPDFVEAFPNKDKKPKPIGNRTIVAVIFKNDNINVRGGCAWDADSNLRDLGSLPNTPTINKTTPSSLFAQLNVFNNIGNYKYLPPTSNNNNPIYNPLFLPRVNDVNKIARTKQEIDQFLNEVGSYKKTWVQTLKKDTGGYNDKFGNYLNSTYNTGLEPEILTEPKNKQPYYKKKFDLSEVLCVAFITDGKKHCTKTTAEYKSKALSFLKTATGKGGWINPVKQSALEAINIVSINSVSLPPVPIAGTTASKENIGKEWVTYLTCPEYLYQSPLQTNNFKLIK